MASRFTLSKPSGANALGGGEPNLCLYASLNSFMPGVSTPRKRCVVKTMFLMPLLLEASTIAWSSQPSPESNGTSTPGCRALADR